MSPRCLFILLLALTALPLRAGLTMSIAPSVKPAARGVEVVFRGTLTNTSATDKLYLNDITPSMTGVSLGNLTLQSNSFFSNVPGILLPGESYTDDELFRLELNVNSLPDTYSANVTIRGGSTQQSAGNLATATATLQDAAFDLWRYQQFGALYSTPNGTLDGDFDHDGLRNLAEYALGSDPLHFQSSNNPALDLASGFMSLSYLPDPLSSGVVITVEGSPDLESWSVGNALDVTPPNPIPPGLRTYRYITPAGIQGVGFLRLRFELQP